MILAKPKIGHFKAMMEADRDFASAGEEPYCGCHGRMGYMAWLALVDKQSKPEYLDYGGNPNEIYLLLDDAERICGFGQLRMFDTRDALTWAGHIGYSVPRSGCWASCWRWGSRAARTAFCSPATWTTMPHATS